MSELEPCPAIQPHKLVNSQKPVLRNVPGLITNMRHITAGTYPPSPFTGISNFRDVGRVINSLSNADRNLPPSSIKLKEGALLRSGRLDEATHADRKLMVSEFHVKTVIDLRTKSEHSKRAEMNRKLDRGDTSNGRDEKRDEEEANWDTIRINFVGRKFEMNLLKQLRWWQAIWFFILMLLGYRMAAIRIMGRNVLSPRGLVGLSRDSLRFCQSEILQALEVYLDPQAYPILVHCTQGKDRSGLIVMLVLFILRVPTELVKADYMLSNQGLDRIRASMLKEVIEIGMDERYLQAPGEVVDVVWAFLEEEGGGLEGYLNEIGFGEGKRQKLRDLLLEQ